MVDMRLLDTFFLFIKRFREKKMTLTGIEELLIFFFSGKGRLPPFFLFVLSFQFIVIDFDFHSRFISRSKTISNFLNFSVTSKFNNRTKRLL